MAGYMQPSLRAGGDINKCRFCTLSTSVDRTLLESNAGEMPFAISGEGAQDAPLDGASILAAAAGDQFEYHTMGMTCKLEIGSGGCNPGALLKPDADGKGIAAGAGDKYGAISLAGASEGDIIYVFMKWGELET